MTTYNWTGAGGNDLRSNPNNWSPDTGVPGVFDTADIGPDNFSVTVSGSSGVEELDLGFFFLGEPPGSTVTVNNGGTFFIEGSSNIFRGSTLQSAPGGTIDFLFSGTLTNGGTILVGQDVGGAGGSSTLNISSSVTLSGGGIVQLGEASANPLAPASTGDIANYPSSSATLVNQGNTISGAGSIVLGTFDNQAGGTVEAGLSGRGTLAVYAGTFSDEGNLIAATGATLSLGQNNASASLANSGTVTIDNDGTLTIAGAYTISGNGEILLAPETEQAEQNVVPFAKIVSDGNPAELVLDNQFVAGAGTIGDADLTLVNSAGIIEADTFEQSVQINTGSNVITNGGTLEAVDDGILNIDSPVDNSGTIAANGGVVGIDAAVTVPTFPPGQQSTIDIGANGGLALFASVAGNVTFTGGSAELGVDAALFNGGIGGDIVGATTSDAIYFQGLSEDAQQVSWQQFGGGGTLSLVENNQIIASVELAGQYAGSDFTLINGNEVELVNPSPPSATTADMIMQDGSNGNFEIYDLGNNAIQSGAALGQPFKVFALEALQGGAAAGPGWQVVGLGDFGGDTSDMLLRDLNGQFEIWDVANNNITGSALMGQVGPEWTVSGLGDFSGNANETDMLMRNSNTGAFEVYDISNNTITFAAGMGQVGPEWTISGFGDFSGNADETDMLMRNSNNGDFEVYDIRDNTIASAGPMGQVGLEWTIAGFGDFSGNANETDMLMRDSNNGDFEVYDISGNTITFAAGMGQVGLEWTIAGFGNFSGSADETNMLMRNSNTGAFEYYDITGNQITGAGSMGQVGLEWSVAGIAADPPGSALPSQLAQSMASYAAAGMALDTSSPLAQPPAAQAMTLGPSAASTQQSFA